MANEETKMLKRITKDIDCVRITPAVNGYSVEVEGRDDERDYHTERVLCLNHQDVVELLKEVDTIYAKG